MRFHRISIFTQHGTIELYEETTSQQFSDTNTICQTFPSCGGVPNGRGGLLGRDNFTAFCDFLKDLPQPLQKRGVD